MTIDKHNYQLRIQLADMAIALSQICNLRSSKSHYLIIPVEQPTPNTRFVYYITTGNSLHMLPKPHRWVKTSLHQIVCLSNKLSANSRFDALALIQILALNVPLFHVSLRTMSHLARANTYQFIGRLPGV